MSAWKLAVAVIVALGCVFGGAQPASAATSGDPLSTGCANDAITYKTVRPQGIAVELRYSRTCKTNWLRVSGAGGRTMEAGIWSPHTGPQWTLSYRSAPSGTFWTNMVYAPGNTCVNASVLVVPRGGLTSQTFKYYWC